VKKAEILNYISFLYVGKLFLVLKKKKYFERKKKKKKKNIFNTNGVTMPSTMCAISVASK